MSLVVSLVVVHRFSYSASIISTLIAINRAACCLTNEKFVAEEKGVEPLSPVKEQFFSRELPSPIGVPFRMLLFTTINRQSIFPAGMDF